jgi:Bax protein
MLIKRVIKLFFAALVLFAAAHPILKMTVLKHSNVSTDVKKSELSTSQVKQESVQSKNTANNKPVIKDVQVATKTPLPDFSKYVDVKQKKVAFFAYLTPHVKQINQEIAQQRSFVMALTQYPTDKKSLTQLETLIKKYSIKTDDKLTFVKLKRTLLLRVDELPIELVLMQAANESAWGTSRFALTANNLFGQWCFKKGCGIVPSGRPAGEKYEVRKFSHPVDSIRSYYNNLNTGHAYVDLRETRLGLREQNKALNPNLLADGLLSYSTRREAYVKELKAMIRINKKYIKVD